jgi:hypothetical protein
MRILLFPFLATLVACGGDSLTLSGTLEDSTAATAVWVAGHPDRTEIVEGAFSVAGVPQGDAELVFETRRGEARMLLRALPRGDGGELQQIWFEGDRAFPGRVDFGRAAPVVVNGLRMTSPERIPGEIEIAGTVLSASRDGRTLMIRPVDERLPDLQVSVTPGSIVRSPDGEPVEGIRLEFGDTVELTGVSRDGVVLAGVLVIPRVVTTRRRGRG